MTRATILMRLGPWLLMVAVCLTGSLQAKAKRMELPDRVRLSDFVGIVAVDSTVPSGVVRAQANELKGRFLQIATAKVLDALKGSALSSISINFDNGFTCPNAIYTAGKTYLVFLKKHADGEYSTVNQYYGRFEVDGAIVRWWHESGGQGSPLDDVRREILAAEHR